MPSIMYVDLCPLDSYVPRTAVNNIGAAGARDDDQQAAATRMHAVSIALLLCIQCGYK